MRYDSYEIEKVAKRLEGLATALVWFLLNTGVKVIAACMSAPHVIANSTARPRRYVEGVFGLASDSMEQVSGTH